MKARSHREQVIVADNAHAWWLIELDVETGAFRRRIRSGAKLAESRGWGTIVGGAGRRVVAALYEGEDEGETVQIGTFRRALRDPLLELEASHEKGPYYRFKAKYAGVVEVNVVYWSSIAWLFAKFDPERNSSEGDFFLFLWRRWSEATRAKPPSGYRGAAR